MSIYITSSRLQNHSLLRKEERSDVKSLVSHLTAIQAQNEPAAIEGLILRTGLTEEAVRRSVQAREIVRSWPMRGTLHYVSAPDLKWMLQLCAAKTLATFPRRRAFLGLSDSDAERSLTIATKTLEKTPLMTRAQLRNEWREKGIIAEGPIGYHLICYAATRGLICFGPHTKDGDETLVLLDEWIKKPRTLTVEEGTIELTRRYFSSHGPAQIIDLAWWSGLSITQIKKAIHELKGVLESITFRDKVYYFSTHHISSKSPPSTTLFLPAFDEYLLGYKDRDDIIDPEHAAKIDPARNGVFRPVIVAGGRVVGTWKWKKSQGKSERELTYFISQDCS